MASAFGVSEVLLVLGGALRTSSAVVLQGVLREATEKGLCTVEVQIFAVRVYAEIHQYAGLLEYADTLPAPVRALPEVAALMEKARAETR